MRTERIIQQHLDQASKQWKWLRFLRHSATLGIIVISVLLLLGVVVACGWLTSGGVVTVCLVLLVAGAVLALALLGLVVAVSEPEQDKLARAIERSHPTLMDRLNTLVFLDRLRETPSVRSYYRRIEGQAHSALAGRTPGSPFSSARVVARLCALAALIIVTVWFYLQFTPLAAFTAAGTQLHGEKPQLEKPFEIPTAESEPEPAKETTPWGEVRITKPGRDLTVTRVEDIPLHIEASASEPVKAVEWYTSINGGGEKKRTLPSPTDPRYAVYDPVIELKKFGLSDWDVLQYYAMATTESGGSFVSKVYFVEIQSFREELRRLPGGQDGKCYSLLNQLTGLIERQQEVIQETHRQQHCPDKASDMQDQERKSLAETEDELATATAHLAAGIAGEFGKATVEEPLSHLDRAGESLGGAASAFRERALSQAQPYARTALAELVATRKLFQERIDENPSAFTPPGQGESDPVLEPAETLKTISEFCDKAKAAVEFVRKLAERQRNIAKGTRLGQVRHKTTFTRGLDSRNRPVDSIEEISIREKRVYIYTSWRGLSGDEHKHVCKIFDGSGKIVGVLEMSFTSGSGVWNTWSWHDFDQSKNKPGTWRFEIYLDGQKVIEKSLQVLPANEAARARPPQRRADESFHSLDQNSIFRQLADKEDVLRQEFAEFEEQHAGICRPVQKQCAAAADGLEQAADALQNQHGEAQQRTTLAAEQLDRLAEALEKQTPAQQLANAYKLKSMLDEQVKLLKRLEQQPDAMTTQKLQEACRNMKETTSQLKRIAEEKSAKQCFGQKLREALSDENKRTLDSQCDSLGRAEGNNARRQAAGAAKAGLQKVSQAFTVSQPQLLAELQQDDAFQPGGQRSLDHGIEHLESLLQSSQDGSRLSAEDRKKLQQEALTDIEKGIEDLGSDTESSEKTYRALREFYTPSVTVDPKVIQRLIEQLDNLSVELVEVRSEEPGEPEIRHIDPEKLPQAYRERIRKYFEKLSEQ